MCQESAGFVWSKYLDINKVLIYQVSCNRGLASSIGIFLSIYLCLYVFFYSPQLWVKKTKKAEENDEMCCSFGTLAVRAVAALKAL